MNLRIHSIEKIGYIPDLIRFGSFLYGDRWSNPGFPYTNRASPVLFHLWKKTSPEPLIQHEFTLPLEKEGQRLPWRVNLLTGARVSDGPLSAFDLTVRKTDASEGEQRQGALFTLEFEARNAGIKTTSDFLPYRAPEFGYVSKLRLPIERALALQYPGWRTNLYMQLRGGKAYAGIQAELSALNYLNTTAYINPAGSRVLEPDPALQITDPADIERLDRRTNGTRPPPPADQ